MRSWCLEQHNSTARLPRSSSRLDIEFELYQMGASDIDIATGGRMAATNLSSGVRSRLPRPWASRRKRF